MRRMTTTGTPTLAVDSRTRYTSDETCFAGTSTGQTPGSGKETMRILIAEDSAPSRLALERVLVKWGYEVVPCRDGSAAWEQLQLPDAPRLAILDWMMPGYSGPEICRMLRAKGGEPYTYLLLLTSKTLKEDLIAGMEAGADDYVTKPFDLHELNVRLRAGMRILDLQAELLEAREKLREQATKDSLTGLWNRRSIMEILEREQARSQREGAPIGVLMIDLDHFKQVNDCFGHLAGDEVLREAGRRLLASVRPYDGVGRYGGEEFLVVLPGCDEAGLRARAESMRAAIAAPPLEKVSQGLTVSASFGATVFMPQSAVSVSDLIRIADEALYEAKHTGRNRVVLRSPLIGTLR
ncbi:MAG: Response regulator PleD [Bryobacteraceae bacterium]|nr:Response regulator PleD [Bryobacteraceae bacterium]